VTSDRVGAERIESPGTLRAVPRPRTEPVAPRVATDVLSTFEVELADGVDLAEVVVTGDFVGQRCRASSIESSRVDRARFTGADLARLRLTDVAVDGADFSGADLEGASFSRVEFRNCRLSGVELAQARLRDVRFSGCRLDGANLRMAKAERVWFSESDLHDADFGAAELVSVCFFDSDLHGVDFSRAGLVGARFHGSSLDGIKGADALRGVVIETTQVMPLAIEVFSSLGIRVEDDRDPPSSER
jgi:uncharacterized protein YjbI with pentapeptide repeats